MLANDSEVGLVTKATPSNINVDDEDTTKTDKRNKNVITKDKLKEAVFQCEWNMCVTVMKDMKPFLFHVADHIVATNELPAIEGFPCHWRSCGIVCLSKVERDRHVYFHAFHSRIKGIGEVVMKYKNLKCHLDDLSRNIIPEISDTFECMWDECAFIFVSVQDFYWHCEAHARSVEHEGPFSENTVKYFKCSWRECNAKTKSIIRLAEHVRSHTQEKIVACPNCGSIFSSICKFQDHCYRNLTAELLKFVCYHCKGKFATKRLLRDHIRSHVNHFKCPHCEMTCPSKSAMEAHIIYRHTNNKPFECPECDKRFKMQQDVIKHLTVHSAEPSFECSYPDCDFKCRSYSTYFNHTKKVHTKGRKEPYLCHICEKTFTIGTRLTRHLKNCHDFHWPAGHARFRYSKDEDGYYKLQTTRFESIELAQEIMNDEANSNVDDPDGQLTIALDYDNLTSENSPRNCESPLGEWVPLPDLTKLNNIESGPLAKKMKTEEKSVLKFQDL